MIIKFKTLLLTVSLLIVSMLATAVEIDAGKTMYEKDCVSCHDSSVFTREDKKVNDIEGLNHQVNACANGTGASWKQDDVENVVAYLNQEFYKFANKEDE